MKFWQNLFLVLLGGFFLYSCAFGAASGYKLASEPRTVNYNEYHYEILSRNFDEWLNGNTSTVSPNIASGNKAQMDGGSLLVIGAIGLTLLVVLGGKRGG